jgi:hypothetical protein
VEALSKGSRSTVTLIREAMSETNETNPTSDVAATMLKRANEFLDTLKTLPPQRDLTPDDEYALFPFEHRFREKFDYFAPSARKFFGLPLRYMNRARLKAAEQLLAAGVSDIGFRKIEQIRELENVLTHRDQKSPLGLLIVRDPDAYYVSIFATLRKDGTIDDSKPWSWRFEGHHLSLHWTLLGNRVVSSTPQFIGAQPLEVVESDPNDVLPAGTRVLEHHEDLARQLIGQLTPDQARIARSEIPWDIETTNASDALSQRHPHRLEDAGNGRRGILFKDLNTGDQQNTLWELIKAHASFQTGAVQAARLREISDDPREGAGRRRERIRFFYMLGTKHEGSPREPLYYKIRGETFVIEYLNKAFTVPSAHPDADKPDHQHTVWRDFENDWGRAQLAQHSALNTAQRQSDMA